MPGNSDAGMSRAGEPNALDRATAADSVAGFAYQLHRALEALFDLEEGQSLGVEVLDDYHVEDAAGPRRLAQLKLHQVSSSLSDGAVDLWKTLGIWARAVADGSLDLSLVSELRLVTTATVPAGSIANDVVSRRPPVAIATRLLEVPRSRDARLALDFEAVHALGAVRLAHLTSKLRIEATAAPLGSLGERIRRRMRYSGFHPETLDDAHRMLVGWYEAVVVAALAERRGPLISANTFHAALADVRDHFPRGALPVRHAAEEPSETELLGLQSKTFLRQLELIGAGAALERSAVRDYLRAVRERTTWLDRVEVLPDEMAMFDRELREEWEIRHAGCCAEATGTDETGCRQAGHRHYLDVQQIQIRLNPRWPAERYVTRGSYHWLADLRKVGWHPRWFDLLEAIERVRPPAGDAGGRSPIVGRPVRASREDTEPSGHGGRTRRRQRAAKADQ